MTLADLYVEARDLARGQPLFAGTSVMWWQVIVSVGKISRTMTRSELIEKLAARFPQLLARDVELAVHTIFSAMIDALKSGDRIEIRGFGSLGLNYRPPRVGRNPKSGEKVQVPGKAVPHFKPGKELRERVDVVPVLSVRTTRKRGVCNT